MDDSPVGARAGTVRRMEVGDYFIVGIIFLQFLAVCGYAWKKRWLEATVYGAYMTAQIALLFLSLRGRV